MGKRERPLRVVVVGAGAGGLASAISLASAGFDVCVVERALHAGGKIGAISVGQRSVDAGPTVLTMRWVFEELFARAGRALGDYVTLQPSSILARHGWPDGTRLDLHADPERSAEAIAEVFGAGEADAFRRFARDAKATFEAVEGPFLRSQRPGPSALLRSAGSMGLRALARIDGLRTMSRALEQRFSDPRLRQLFGRYATYCGSSPFEAPATLNLIAHVESLGVHRVSGGMRSLARALARLAEELGVEMRFGVEVSELVMSSHRAVTGVRLTDGTTIACDAVVFNGDVAALPGLVPPSRSRALAEAPPRDRSLSAVTIALVAETSGFPLVHHNVFFSDDYAREFEELLGERRVPRAPTVYACAQDRGDDAIELGEERMLVIVNAPATGDRPEEWSAEERQRCVSAAYSAMESCGLRVKPSASVVRTPVELDLAFPGAGGALYGPRATGALSALARRAARSDVVGLYLAGGSVHPGPGVPMAALSGTLAAAAIVEDLGSTRPSRRPVINGTTSTL